MVSLELLWAVGNRRIGTTAQVASELGIAVSDAERQLRAAKRAGLVVDSIDQSRNVPRGFDRQHWELTDAGRKERSRLEALADEL